MERALVGLLALAVACSSSSEDADTTTPGSGGSVGAAGDAATAAGGAGAVTDGSVQDVGATTDAITPADAPNDAPAATADGGMVSCDPRAILCRRAPPVCGSLEVPSVQGTCYGPCVKVELCACTEAEACPDPGQYTCMMSAQHCTPYLR